MIEPSAMMFLSREPSPLLFVSLLFCLSANPSTSSKIIFLIPVAGPSQLNVVAPLANELANRSHEVVVITSAPPPSKFDPRIRVHQTLAPSFEPESLKLYIQQSLTGGPTHQMYGLHEFAQLGCEKFFTDPEVKKLLAHKGPKRQFDLAFVDTLVGECATAITPLIANHAAYLASCTLMPWKRSAVPTPPSIVPNFFESLPSRMNFWQRCRNSLTFLGIQSFYQYKTVSLMQQLVSQFVPQAPSIVEAEKHVTFTLVNADPVLYSARPSLPNVVAVGAMHCREPLPLPKELEDFVQSSGEHGFIIFSLGTNARATFLPDATVNSFLSAFSKLEQKVLWKFEDELAQVPANVKLVKWLPQQDLLGHPKIRLFITHGGLLSLQEAVFHHVPVVVIPLFGDQPGNAGRVKELRIGEKLSPLNITRDGVLETVNKILGDKRYEENVKRYSAILKDQPESPLTRAVFWTEYVIRHEGARHLLSPAEDLDFFQYLLLDVIAVVVASTFASVALAVCLFRALFGKGKKSTKSKGKKLLDLNKKHE